MVGFRTIAFNLLAPAFLWLANKGIQLDAEAQAAAVTLVLSVGNLVLRWFTTTPIGTKP